MTESKNLYQRISAIMADVAYLQKDDKVDTGGGKSYKAITEEKVTGAIRAAMIKHGVVIFPVAQRTTRDDEAVKDKYGNDKVNRITTVETTYRIVNVDNPDDCIETVSTGTGVDTQDKGVGKAMTYAYKYLLLRTFAIPTGDDPDKISSDLYSEELYGKPQGTAKQAEKTVPPRQAPVVREIPKAISMPKNSKEFAVCIQQLGALCVAKFGAEHAGEQFTKYSGYKKLKDVEPESVALIYDLIQGVPAAT